MGKKIKKQKDDKAREAPVYGNPEYSAKEDIYNNEQKLPLNEDENIAIKEGESKLRTGEDLDVPGAELDDADELIGEEDEENNYYSLGGEDHEDLEEDKGD
jgi:hypothetical protein